MSDAGKGPQLREGSASKEAQERYRSGYERIFGSRPWPGQHLRPDGKPCGYLKVPGSLCTKCGSFG